MSRKKGGFWGQRTYIFDKEQPYILYMLEKTESLSIMNEFHILWDFHTTRHFWRKCKYLQFHRGKWGAGNPSLRTYGWPSLWKYICNSLFGISINLIGLQQCVSDAGATELFGPPTIAETSSQHTFSPYLSLKNMTVVCFDVDIFRIRLIFAVQLL